jgi:uncharacterized membrane protein YhdT
MPEGINLKEAEQKVFKSAFGHGLWDIFIGCILLQFAIGPFLSKHLGDFWSSAVFLPFWALVYIVIWLVRKYVVTPRVGIVKFGSWRRSRLIKFNVIMFIVCLFALILGVLSSLSFDAMPALMHTARFSLIVLIGFSIAAYFLNFTRLYLYGVLIALSPLAGEWLYANMGVPHHGYPITFGITAGIIIFVGLVKFIFLLRTYRIPTDQQFSAETSDG